ncbi:ubiquitin conjugation factor E4 A [Condylostylus longicornis]|uniref:ubiquitin conjugation factor E4 A n=1 Tax=Condylostylus longicornis TaxID=2530218 RepID=UPI00244DAEF4|nr:ubiquitin conjugation factor E4 A [Condylostylus longicornis]
MSDNNGTKPIFNVINEENISTTEKKENHYTNTMSILEKKINNLIESIFLFTLDKNSANDSKQLIFMEEVGEQTGSNMLNIDILEQALFERLLLQAPADYLIPNDKILDDTANVTETKVIHYLYRSYLMCYQYNGLDAELSKVCQEIKSLILRNVSTSMKQPDLYEGQSLSSQWLELLKDPFDPNYNIIASFLSETTKEMYLDDEANAMSALKGIFYPMLSEIQKVLRAASMISIEKWIIPALQTFISDKSVPQLGELFMDFTTPNPGSEGVRYAETLLGQLLCISILPKKQNDPYEYYDNFMDSLSTTLNDSLWTYLKNHLDKLHTLFKSILLLGGSAKSKILTWIGNCLHVNTPRGQIWNTHNISALGNLTSASDAFMINLCGVLLRLCVPLFKPGFKVLLVDPTYCAVTENDRLKKNVHLKNVCEETCLLPVEENQIRITVDNYNFISDCFFMTHKAIDLSYRVCMEKFARMSREIHRLQGAYQDTMEQGAVDVAQNIMQMLTSQSQQFLCLKNTIMEPCNDQLLLQFYEATAVWLIEITAKSENDLKNMSEIKCFAPKERQNISLPLNNKEPHYLRSLPEHILENIVGYMTFVRHFKNQAIELDIPVQNELFRTILIFMGSVDRVRNPHLRARLAEGLESLLPKDTSNTFRSSFKTNLFDCHPDRLEIIANLLDVFVSIEMTGQSVQFEQKFNYRRPMYRIMEFLWSLEEQKEVFKTLAIEAVRNIEAVKPPIFLRFVNLLMNDAIFLLDESLSNLQQIRQLQAAQDAGEWDNLPQNERQQNFANLQHLGMITKFDNILGRDTINILKLLTSEIKEIFCHESMVDRIASMLNYFLLYLVGPKKGNFKVKDKKEFEFDPANTVMEICRIYVNLEGNKNFCLAVSQDGRSYSGELFAFAEQVLIRIGGGQLIGDIREFSDKVKRLEKQHKEDQQALIDPPDEFLDPIMSTLMMDPVILPSSHVTVDRATITRHLLSDQSDPFNRSPLTMDQVKSNAILKNEIDAWIKEKRHEYSEKQLQNTNKQIQEILKNERETE